METYSTDQQRIVDAGLLERPCVINMPTCSGKTWIARKAISITLERGLKAVYLSPLRAIATELSVSWQEKFVGYRVGVYTGEVGVDALDNPTPAEADVLIATPEKLDLYLRTWTDHLHWLAKIDLLVVDEVHTLDSGRRGATLEGVISRLKVVNPHARVMLLSATLGNPHELSKWIGGEAFVSRDRPIPLTWRIRTHTKTETKGDVAVQEALDTLAENGQVIIFVQSRPRTETLVKKLREAGINAATHHAGLSTAARDRAEAAYRAGEIGVLVATPTLAMGVNLPARKVVLHDLQRWDGDRWEDLTTNEVWQLAGRAGRRGLDTTGEVVLIAPSWNQKTARRYIKGEFEDIKSQLATDQGFAEQLMVAFGSRMAVRQEQAQRVMEGTLFGQSMSPGELSKRVTRSVQDMLKADMLERSDDGYIRATRLGRIATRFQLTARTVICWRKLERHLPNATLLDVLIAICASPDFTTRLRVSHQEVANLQAVLDREVTSLHLLQDAERRSVLGSGGKDLLGAVKAALVLRTWTRLGDAQETAQMFDVMDHEVEEARKEAVRMLQALSALLASKPRKVAGKGCADEPGLVEKAGALCTMVCAGLDSESATLALVDGIGPVMARRLMGAGFDDIEALAMADAPTVAKIDGVSLQRATKWIAQAGALSIGGNVGRYREVYRHRTQSSGNPNTLPGLDYSRWSRAALLQVKATGANWEVSGGSQPHTVTAAANGRLRCDCRDAKGGRLCKHTIAVMHFEGTTGIPRFDTGFPEAIGGLDLETEWTGPVRVAQWR